MFGDENARLVVLRGPSGQRPCRRVLWRVGLRVALAREGNCYHRAYRNIRWLPTPAGPPSSMAGMTCRYYALAPVVLVAAGCAGWWLVGGALALLICGLVTVLLMAGHRQFRAGQRGLPDCAGLADHKVLSEAGQHAEQALRDWPALGELGAGLQPGPVLEDALWELAGVLTTRARIYDLRRRLAAFGSANGCDPQLRDHAATLVATTDGHLAWLDGQVRARADSIARLAERCHRLVAYRRARCRLDQLASQLSHILDASPAPETPLSAMDPAEPLADQVTAVLDAYRDLSEEPLQPR